MNKTININLAGIIFYLDEQAYARLTEYLNSIKSRFKEDSSQEEILSDIEARIAELFSQKLEGSKEVIGVTDIEEVIAVMGSPEDYQLDDEDDSSESYSGSTNTSTSESYRSHNFGKRLYRDPDEKVVGGVCSGLGAYLGVDPIWLRITWLILFFFWGTGIIVYIILWIAIPEARTTAQKLQMRGEPINISNIEKSVKDEFDKMGNRFSKVTNNPKFGNKISNTVDDIVGMFLSIIKFVLMAAFKLAGIALLILGCVFLLTFVGGIFGHEIVINENSFGFYNLSGYINQILVSESHNTLLYLGIFLLAVAPITWFILMGIRLLFNKKEGHKNALLVSGVASLLGFILLAFVGVTIGRDYKHRTSYTNSYEIVDSTSNSFYLTMNDDIDSPLNDFEQDFEWYVGEEGQFMKYINLTIEKSNSDNMLLKVKKSANGSSIKEARLRAKNMDYFFKQEDSTLLFDDFFKIESDDKWRNQKINIILYVPVGTSVYLDASLMEIVYDIPNVTHTLDYDMMEHTWMMTRNGLACLDCTAMEMEGNFEEEWEEEAERQEIEEKYRDLEEKRKELERLERMLEKREKELDNKTSKTSFNSSPFMFLPQNSSINQKINRIRGFQV